MRAEVPPFEIMRHTFWLGEAPGGQDPRMRRIAECVAAIRPRVEEASREFGDRRTMWSLLAILVHMAVDRGDGPILAAMMRTNARVIELEAGVTLLGFEP